MFVISMKDRIITSMLVALALLSTIAFGTLTSRRVILKEGFEGGMDGWEAGMDLPLDPETDEPVHAQASISHRVSKTGNASLELTIDGRQDEGTLWIQRYIELERTGDLLMEVSFQLYCEHESFNTIAHAVASWV